LNIVGVPKVLARQIALERIAIAQGRSTHAAKIVHPALPLCRSEQPLDNVKRPCEFFFVDIFTLQCCRALTSENSFVAIIGLCFF
jgi:hypothetical protein